MKSKLTISVLFILSFAVRSQAQTTINCTQVIDWLQKATINSLGSASVWIASETQQWDYVCKTTNATSSLPANTQYFGPGSNVTSANGSGTVSNGNYACNPKWLAMPYAPTYYSTGTTKSGSDYLRVNAFNGVYYTTGPYPVVNNCEWFLNQSNKTYCAALPCKAPVSGSPIIIDLDRKGFFLTSADEGVRFDLAGSGKPVQIAWIAWGANNAFLVLPGPDGVTTGKEMFGNYTPQPEPPAGYQRNGFNALAVYDSNHDAIIDSRDPIFKSLRLWTGRPDAHGAARPEDLHTLAELGVNSISLAYRNDKYVDSYGNQFRYVAEANPDKTDRVNPLLYDVWLVEACLKTGGKP